MPNTKRIKRHLMKICLLLIKITSEEILLILIKYLNICLITRMKIEMNTYTDQHKINRKTYELRKIILLISLNNQITYYCKCREN